MCIYTYTYIHIHIYIYIYLCTPFLGTIYSFGRCSGDLEFSSLKSRCDLIWNLVR